MHEGENMANFCLHSRKRLQSLVLKEGVAVTQTCSTYLDWTGAFSNKSVCEIEVKTILS